MNLIKEINDSLKPKDVVQEALDQHDEKIAQALDQAFSQGMGEPEAYLHVAKQFGITNIQQVMDIYDEWVGGRSHTSVEDFDESVDPTYLADEQVDALVDYMHEMISDRQKRGNDMAVGDAAFMALEDVAGFETAPKRVLQKTGERLIAAYQKKFG